MIKEKQIFVKQVIISTQKINKNIKKCNALSRKIEDNTERIQTVVVR